LIGVALDRTGEERLWIERLPCYETPRRHGYCPSVDVIDESDKVYLIMELMTGGNLLSKVVQQEGLCESTVKLIAKTLLMVSGIK
jgi:hypothetical protein